MDWRQRVEAALPGARAALIGQAVDAGAAAEVRALAERWAEAAPDAEDAQAARAAVWLALGEGPRARAALEAFVARRPGSAEGWLALARVEASLADGPAALDRAAAHGARALELDREHEGALYWLATLEGRRHGPAAFVRALDRQVTAGSARAACARAAYAWREGDRALAEAHHRRALAQGAVALVLADLERLGAPDALIAIGRAHYRADVHGAAAGLPLARALVARGPADEARALLEALDAMAPAEVRPEVSVLLAAMAARAPDAPQPTVEPVCWTGPLWSAAGVEGAPDRARAPRWGWLAWADVSGRGRGAAGEGRAARLARAIPALLAERAHRAYPLCAITVLPVVPAVGLLHATAPWDLPLALRMVPAELSHLVEGELAERPDGTLRARVRVWQVERRRLAKTWTASGADGVALAEALEAKLRAYLDGLRLTRAPARLPPLRASALEALADVMVLYLAASGAVPAERAWGVGAAVDGVRRAVAEGPDDAGARALGAALARCLSALGRAVPEGLADGAAEANTDGS